MPYLCHKCSGLLQPCPELPAAYHCGCISGYIRDWQSPVPLDAVYDEQLRACYRSLQLYDQQGRASTDSNRLRVRSQIAAIEAIIGRAAQRAVERHGLAHSA